MRRVITKEEKKILDKYSAYVATGPQPGRMGFSFVALAIGCTIGAILGSILAFGVLGQHHPLSMPVFFLFYISGSVLTPWLTAVIGTKRIRNRLFVVGKTKINGATCVSDIYSSSGTTYTEDDFLDENGRPYRMLWPGSMFPPRRGTRYILVENDGKIFLMYYDKGLKSLVPGKAPQEADDECTIIGHQNQFQNKQNDKADQQRIRKFFRYYKNTNKHRRSLCMLGTGFFGFCLWGIVIFGSYGMFFEGTKYEDRYFPIALPMLFVLTALSLDVCEHLFRRSNRLKYSDITSVKKVVLINTQPYPDNSGLRYFLVAETDLNGNSETRAYVAHDGFDCADAAKMRPGQTIFKYTYGSGDVFFGTK